MRRKSSGDYKKGVGENLKVDDYRIGLGTAKVGTCRNQELASILVGSVESPGN